MHPGDIVDEVAQGGFYLCDAASKESLFSCLLDNAFDAIVGQKFFSVMPTALVTDFVTFAPKNFDEGLEMFHGVEEVHDLDGVREVVVAEFFPAGGPINEPDRFWDREQAASMGMWGPRFPTMGMCGFHSMDLFPPALESGDGGKTKAFFKGAVEMGAGWEPGVDGCRGH